MKGDVSGWQLAAAGGVRGERGGGKEGEGCQGQERGEEDKGVGGAARVYRGSAAPLIRAHTFTCAHTCMRTRTHTRSCTHTRMCTCMHAHISMHTLVHAHGTPGPTPLLRNLQWLPLLKKAGRTLAGTGTGLPLLQQKPQSPAQARPCPSLSTVAQRMQGKLSKWPLHK